MNNKQRGNILLVLLITGGLIFGLATTGYFITAKKEKQPAEKISLEQFPFENAQPTVTANTPTPQPTQSTASKPCTDFKIKAKSGDSATTISRQATGNYLQKTAPQAKTSQLLLPSTHEERVYMEDYLAKRLDVKNIHPGDEITITCQQITEAVAKARILSEREKENLKKYSISIPKIYEAGWVRVDTDFLNSNCEAFCQSKGKACSPSQCDPDPWCKATGGMMEIETWNPKEGIVCDRTWQGQCNATIDRYPPVYNFHCCCK